MRKPLVIVVTALLMLPAVTLGGDPPTTSKAPPAASAPMTTTDTSIGDLMDNPKSRAILDKYIPGFTTADQIDSARNMTLKQVQPYASDTITDDVLAKIDADLAKLPAGK